MHPVDTPPALVGGLPRARRLLGFPAIVALLTCAVPGFVAAGTPAAHVECGQIIAYTAPDPAAPADGSLTIGMLDPWTINADAAVSAEAASVLPSFAGSGPSCIDLSLDVDGNVTALGFAPVGSIQGHVVFDSGSGWYLFANRLIVPTFITDAYPGLEAVFATSAAEGAQVSATFTVDVTSGGFSGVSVSASFCGPADLDGDGNGLVGDAVIRAAVLDADSTDDLARANGHVRCADVETEGTVGQELQLATTVNIYRRTPPPPDPPASDPGPDTATGEATPAGDQTPGSGAPQDLFGLLVALSVLVAVRLLEASVRRAARQPSGA